MATLLPFLAFVVGLAAVLGAVAWLGLRVRRRGNGGAIAGPVDEIFRPNAHYLRLEAEAQEQLVAPRPAPDDKLR
jgi:hypothetical protein